MASPHTVVIGYIRDARNASLPQDLSVIAEESVSIDTIDGESSLTRADVAVVQDTAVRLPVTDRATATLVIDQPETLSALATHRWLEIRDTQSRLVTVIEVISPSNKTLSGAANFADRQERLMASGVNIVDIDLIRRGARAVPYTFISMLKHFFTQTQYLMVSERTGEFTQSQITIARRLDVYWSSRSKESSGSC